MGQDSQVKHFNHVGGSHAPLDAESQVLTGELIDNVTDLEHAPLPIRIKLEINGPHCPGALASTRRCRRGAVRGLGALRGHTRSASAFSSFTTICSGVCFENFLMVIHSARPQAAGTTQNNPLKTNDPKNPDLSTADCRGGVQRAGRRGGRCRREIVPGGVCCTVLDLLAWFPNNVARNFHVNLSSIEIALLELQRLWQMLKIQGRELRARFMGTP